MILFYHIDPTFKTIPNSPLRSAQGFHISWWIYDSHSILHQLNLKILTFCLSCQSRNFGRKDGLRTFKRSQTCPRAFKDSTTTKKKRFQTCLPVFNIGHITNTAVVLFVVSNFLLIDFSITLIRAAFVGTANIFNLIPSISSTL